MKEGAVPVPRYHPYDESKGHREGVIASGGCHGGGGTPVSVQRVIEIFSRAGIRIRLERAAKTTIP